MTVFELAEKSPVTVGALVALLPLLMPRVRTVLIRLIKTIATPFCSHKDMMTELGSVRQMVASIQYQVQTNDGGSLKDSILRMEAGQKGLTAGLAKLESYRQHDFWTRPRAGMEIYSTGIVIQVSEATCKLFGVSDPEELSSLSWMRFLDSHHVDAFIRSFRETAETGSIFRFAINLRDNNGNDRGVWEFKATPIDDSKPQLYSGLFAPFDDLAKEIAGRNGWS